ncbi:hypothetical protein [Algoriphagus namhaensis]
MKDFFYFNLPLLLPLFLAVGCQLEPLEKPQPTDELIEIHPKGPFDVQPAKLNDLQALGSKMNKRLGVDVIRSAQSRELSDFIFDLDASLVTLDSTQRKTYTVPFLEKENRFSTFNLVLVTDSAANLLDQYVLAYSFDSLQYRSFIESGDFLQSGTKIKRFSFSSFFNDSNPFSLERCQGITDENGDPVVCDEVSIDAGSSSGAGGGSAGGGDAWVVPGGATGSGGGPNAIPCTWSISYTPCDCGGSHTHSCGCPDQTMVITISCKDPNKRQNNGGESLMECMNCDISDFGTPAFTPTKISTAINRDLGSILSDFHLWYLSENAAFASEFRSALLADVTVDVDAALFTLAAEMNGSLTGDFNSQFGLAIEDLMSESSADFSDPGILRIFQLYFDTKYAILRQNNPSWSEEKLFYETSKEAIHLALDGIGLIEGLGTPADLLNAGLYYLEGDRVNGNLSLVAATPVIGLFSTTVKGALRLKGVIPGTTKKITQVWVKDGSLIKFGGTRLRTAMGITDPLKHAHHILPVELVDHPVVQKAAKFNGNPFHINEINNGIEVLSTQNTTHPAYNDFFRSKLDNYLRRNPNGSPEQANTFILDEILKAKAAIQSLPLDGKINSVTWN